MTYLIQNKLREIPAPTIPLATGTSLSRRSSPLALVKCSGPVRYRFVRSSPAGFAISDSSSGRTNGPRGDPCRKGLRSSELDPLTLRPYFIVSALTVGTSHTIPFTVFVASLGAPASAVLAISLDMHRIRHSTCYNEQNANSEQYFRGGIVSAKLLFALSQPFRRVSPRPQSLADEAIRSDPAERYARHDYAN